MKSCVPATILLLLACVPASAAPPSLAEAARIATKFLESETLDGENMTDNFEIISLTQIGCSSGVSWTARLGEKTPGQKIRVLKEGDREKIRRSIVIDQEGRAAIERKRVITLPSPRDPAKPAAAAPQAK